MDEKGRYGGIWNALFWMAMFYFMIAAAHHEFVRGSRKTGR